MMYEPQPFYEQGSEGPAVTFGAVDTHGAAQVQAQAEFESKYGHYPPRSLEESLWLNARVGAIKAAANVDQVIRTDAGELVHATGRPAPGGFNLTSPVVLAGAAGVGLLLLTRRRRRNPRRRSKAMPFLVLGGVAAALWYGGKKTLQAAQTALTPAEQGGVEPA